MDTKSEKLLLVGLGLLCILDFWVRVIPKTLKRSNPQFWSSNGTQPEIRQEKRNHAHDFNFPENLEIWSRGGPRSLTDLLRTPPRLNRYPRISDAGGL